MTDILAGQRIERREPSAGGSRSIQTSNRRAVGLNGGTPFALPETRLSGTLAGDFKRRRRRDSGLQLRIARHTIAFVVAIPFALAVSGPALAVIDYFHLVTHRMGLSLPATELEPEVMATEPETDEPMSIDPTVFESIRRTEYVVRQGDTIWEIAQRFALNPGTILSMNPINDVRRLLPGTALSIPDRNGIFHAVQPGESLSSIASSYSVSTPRILDANDLATQVLQTGTSLFIPGARMDEDAYLLAIGELLRWPLRSYVFTSGFGMREDPITDQWRLHTGLDLAGPMGSPVLAARSGRVVHAEYTGNYGNLVIVDHGDAIRTLYSHMSSFNVTVGEYVSAGEVIGQVGSTGRSTGPHVHFSVTRSGRWEDPLAHLP